MKKFILISIITVSMFSYHSAAAQIKVQAGVMTPVWPHNSMGYAGAIGYEATVGPGLAVGGSVGFINFPGRWKDLNVIPVLGTFRKGYGAFYMGADAGINIADGDAAVALVPKIGVKISKVSIEGRYSALPMWSGQSDSTYGGLLLGFTF